MIGRRISGLSSNKDFFEAEVAVYSSALKASGYNNELQYTGKTVAKKRSRRMNVIWFNLPWNDEVSTNVAKKCLAMIDTPSLFNRSTVKVSYSSMPNMAKIILGYNKMMTGSCTH